MLCKVMLQRVLVLIGRIPDNKYADGKGAIFYGIKPEIVVTAYNAKWCQHIVTKNYTEATNFMKLEPDDS